MVEPMEHMSDTNVKRKRPLRVATPRRVEFSRIRNLRAFEEIADQIRKELSDRRLRAGDRLPPERALAEQFGVSRNTLREALRSLENAGLLRLQKGATGGAFVRESTGDAIITGLRDMFHLGAIQPEHLTEARVMIESIAVRTACERATPEDIEALNANIAAAERAVRDHIDFYDQARDSSRVSPHHCARHQESGDGDRDGRADRRHAALHPRHRAEAESVGDSVAPSIHETL